MLAVIAGLEAKEQALLAMGVTFVVAVFLIVAGGMLIHAYNLAKEREIGRDRLEQEAELKRLMIERGMSADEIERVLAARLAKPEPPVALSA